jgi:hypothetical protein
MRRFSNSDPERCEVVLAIIKARLNEEFAGDYEGIDVLRQSLGGCVAELLVGKARPFARTWLKEWADEPDSYGETSEAVVMLLRGEFFFRYRPDANKEMCLMCDRAQEGLTIILSAASKISGEAYAVLTSDSPEAERQAASKRYAAAEKIIHQASNQLYFGSGAYAKNTEGVGLPDATAMKRFMTDYSEILAMLAASREPATHHHFIEVYEFLIPGDPVAVFEALNAILHGRAKEEGYHYETLGTAAIVRIIRRYIADHRVIFEDEGRRAKLVGILQLFSEVGWPDALQLLYELPDLLR